MSAPITATLTFSPALPATVTVSGSTFTDVKAAALAAIQAQRTAPAGQLVAIDAALAAVSA